MNLKELEDAIRKLNPRDRATLAKWIVESLDELSESEVSLLWAEEAEHRLERMRIAPDTGIPAGDVLRKAKSILS